MAFFSKTFGWNFIPFGPEQDYWVIMTGDDSKAGINGGLMRQRGEGQPVTCTIKVDSIDQSIEDVTANGGEIVVPKMPVPGVGFIAYFKDTEGNIFGMFEEVLG